jgi:putative addiction module killer protein
VLAGLRDPATETQPNVMIEVRKTDYFLEWFQALKDIRVRAKIQARIDRAEIGNLGDCQPVGSGVSEMRIHFGAGYRVYFIQHGTALIILLAGGNKSSQRRDITAAIELAEQLRKEDQ